ncbi:MAG TPA: MOSC domain-containing protein [Draconibacterium sp.]|nr:MOSC domain-containing protein [Draconibacterium sp.]
MKVISTNIGKTRIISWNGKEVETGIFKFPVNQSIFLDLDDVENDHVMDRRYHGGKDKACYLYSADNYSYWHKLYPGLEMPWGIFGENITVEGLNEEEVNIGDIFKIGEAVVQATQPRQPCFKLGFRFNNNQIVQQFVDSGFSGVYVRILEKGNVKTGDVMKRIKRKDSLSVRKVYELLYTSEFQKEAIELAVKDSYLAESCRKDLLKRWGDEI